MIQDNVKKIMQNYPFFQTYLSGKITKKTYLATLKLFSKELLKKGLTKSDLQTLSTISAESFMTNIKKIKISGKVHTIEILETEDIIKLAHKHGGNFKGDFGIYLILTDGKNEKNSYELSIKGNEKYYHDVFIGRMGIIRAKIHHPQTKELVYSGPQLEDFLISESFRRQGYMTTLIKLAIEVLQKKGFKDACIINADDKSQQLLEKMRKSGLNIKQIYHTLNSKDKMKNVYILSFG